MEIFYSSDEEVEQLVQSFNARTLDKAAWTHAAHLTVGIWYLKKYDLNEATCRIKSGIISYNLAVGGENTGTSGYHESMTLFWIDVLNIFVSKNPELSIKDSCNKLLNSPISDKNLPFSFYNKDKLLSPRARARATAPDRKKISAATLFEE